MKRSVKTFHGKPCIKDGTTERYERNRKCRQCNITDMVRRNKLRAESREVVPVVASPSGDTAPKLLAMRW